MVIIISLESFQYWTQLSCLHLFQLPPAPPPNLGMSVTPSLTISVFLPRYSAYRNSLNILLQRLSGMAKHELLSGTFHHSATHMELCHSLTWKHTGVNPRLHAWPAPITALALSTITSFGFFFFHVYNLASTSWAEILKGFRK